MKRILAFAVVAACMAGTTAAEAATFSFTTLDDAADPTFNQLLGINDSGVIAGYFGSGAAGHPNQGYTIAPPYTTFVPDNLPGSRQTQATGINAQGTTSGFWSDTNLGTGDNNFGFIRIARKDGTYEYVSINDPLVGGTPLVNQVLGINIHNNAVGFYNDAAGVSHGFAYLLANNQFAPITPPHATASAATGINDRDLICGFFVNGHGLTLGYVMPETNGTAIVFRVPGASVTQLLGINDKGRAVGFYVASNQVTHGLYYNPSNGMWQRVDDPNGVNGTVLNGLNNKGQLVGFYTDAAGNVHGMVVTVTP